ncbi:PAS domain-containing sensor histidine kinase, partial [Mesorhizobium sanjuanii]
MPSENYSFLDVAVLDAVRQRFAAGDAIAVLSADLEQVIWANGPGAAVFGYPDIEAIIGSSAGLPMVARRQIMATSGFPEIGRDRAITVRLATGLTSRAIGFLATAITMPDGENAIMLAVPAAQAGSRNAAEIADRAISGFTEDGHFIAFVDAKGGIEAASDGFSALGILPETLAALVADVTNESERIVKRLVPGGTISYPAGLARLTDERHLLVVIDEDKLDSEALGAEDPAETEAGADAATEAVPPIVEEIQAAAEHDIADATEQSPQAADSDRPAAGGTPAQHDHWYFSASEDETREPARPEAPLLGEAPAGADGPARRSAQHTAEPASPAERPMRGIDRTAAPLRFVWRTDAEGKFSALSPEFAEIVGKPAADVIG